MPGQFDLVAFGNPLLDMQIRDGEEVLKKYNLKANDAILAEESHQSIYDHIVEKYDVVYVAGGAAQNTARCAQYVLPPNSTAYLGAVGDDDLAKQLRAANDKEGLRAAYQVNKELPTGSCAAIITGHDRSLVTRLGAAESFNKAHLETPEVKKLIAEAKFFYMGGFFVTHGAESGLIIAKEAKANGVPFSLNLSAPFIPQFFSQQLDSILPYASLVIGNESEAVAYSEAHKWGTTDLKAIAEKLAASPSELSGQRTVIITHGSEPTIVVSGGQSAREIPTAQIASADIVDTNGAGDAFAGGVVGALILGKSLDEAVTVGQKLGSMCIGQVGPCLKFPKEQIV